MNLDALPLDVLLPLGLPVAVLLWLLWAWLCRADRVRDREADDAVQHQQSDSCSEQPNEEQVRSGQHACIVARGGTR